MGTFDFLHIDLLTLLLYSLGILFVYGIAHHVIDGLIDHRQGEKRRAEDGLKNDFIALASHQLRAPLASLKWYGELLEKQSGGKLTKKQQEYVRRMNLSTERMNMLISEFLHVSRIEEGQMKHEPKRFNTRHLVKGIVESLRHVIHEKKIKVSIVNKAKTKTLLQDPDLVRELYVNVISNAVKYTPDNGKVKITLEDHGSLLLLRVKDTGVGIPADEHHKIFSKFFRASNIVKDGFSGTGLGLYAARRIAHHLGGDVSFESELGGGSTFLISLPRTRKKEC